MKNRNMLYLTDIIESINKIEAYIKGIDYDSFCCNEMMFDAVIRNLEIIGEASKNVSDEIKSKYPEIPWKQMTGVRNILIHEYFGVDESIIWEIVTRDLQETKPLILKVIQEEGNFT